MEVVPTFVEPLANLRSFVVCRVIMNQIDGSWFVTRGQAFEAPQQYRRAEWQKTIGRHQDAFDETWSGYAVGLRRALQSPEHLDEEIRRLLDDFLKCLE